MSGGRPIYGEDTEWYRKTSDEKIRQCQGYQEHIRHTPHILVHSKDYHDADVAKEGDDQCETIKNREDVLRCGADIHQLDWNSAVIKITVTVSHQDARDGTISYVVIVRFPFYEQLAKASEDFFDAPPNTLREARHGGNEFSWIFLRISPSANCIKQPRTAVKLCAQAELDFLSK